MNEEDFQLHLCKGIIISTRQDRTKHWRRGFEKAIQKKDDQWAFLFKAFELIVNERYDSAKPFLKKIKLNDEISPILEIGHQFATAYLERRLAKQAYGYLKKYDNQSHPNFSLEIDKIGNYGKLLKSSVKHAKDIYYGLIFQYPWEFLESNETSSIYKVKSNYRKDIPIEFTAASLHSLGILCRFEELEKNYMGKYFDWIAQFNHEEDFFRAAMCMSENLNFASPYAKLGHLFLERFDKLCNHNWQDKSAKELFSKTIKFAEKAVDISSDYTGPLLDISYAKIMINLIETNGTLDLEKGRPELIKAVKANPFDPGVKSQLEMFLNALEIIDGEYQYLYNKLVVPTIGINSQLKNWVMGEPESILKTENKDTLLILKRWSSYSPILTRGPKSKTYGGGYLLNWAGRWIAIDPGVGFLEQMYAYGISANDLDVIAITHDHTDHQQDMQPLIAAIGEQDKRFSDPNDKTKRPLYFLLTTSSYKRWWSRLPPFKYRKPELRRLRSGNRPIQLFKNQVSVMATPTFGHFDLGDFEAERDLGEIGTGVGLIFNLKENNKVVNSIGITGDTAYHNSNKETISPYFKKCDIIIIHISTVDDLDSYLFTWDEIPGNDNKRLKEFLKDKYEIEWVTMADIKKINDGKTIKISSENNSLLLRLNNKKSKVILEIDAVRADKFDVIENDKKFEIYDSSKLIKPISLTPPFKGFYGFYKKHLGFWGTISFIRDITEIDSKQYKYSKKKLILLNEFGEELSLIRESLAREIENYLESPYRFKIDEISGKDSDRFIQFVKKNYNIDINWIKSAKVIKNGSFKTILYYTQENSLIFKFNPEISKVIMEVDDNRIDEFYHQEEEYIFGKCFECFSTDIGTRISLRQNKILCHFGKMCSNFAIGRNENSPIRPFEKIEGENEVITTYQGWRDRKLVYLCKEHQWVFDTSMDYSEIL